MTSDDVLTLKASVLFIIDKAGGALDKYRIFKSLYFANKEHLNRYGRLITSDDFYALPHGPVPTILSNVLNSVAGCPSKMNYDKELFSPISKSITSYKDDASNYYSANELPDMDELSESDVECLIIGLSKCKDSSFDSIKKESHDAAWEKANKKRKKRINPIDMADGVSQNMKDFIVDGFYCR
ncbi:Panacea domain-containing protein [Bacteroides reticulotermitis]|uniref:Panacea domain-containing protein n=1 Tax=Bacteroides reticulotermitis TaxID=1133319 RepID=UPI003A840E8C